MRRGLDEAIVLGFAAGEGERGLRATPGFDCVPTQLDDASAGGLAGGLTAREISVGPGIDCKSKIFTAVFMNLSNCCLGWLSETIET